MIHFVIPQIWFGLFWGYSGVTVGKSLIQSVKI